MDAIFRVDGNRVTTSPNAAGPWDPNMQHGSPPAALVAWAVEAIPTQVPMRIARVTVDLMRPVPVAPLTIETEILREGRKIQLCAVRLRAEGVIVVGATVLKVKVQENELPPEAEILPVDLPGPDKCHVEPADFSSSPFVTGMSLRAARGRFGVPGPGAIWYRLDQPIVEGFAVSQAMRAMVAADISATALPPCWISGTGRFSMPTSPSISQESRSASGSCSTPSPGSAPTAPGWQWRGSPTSTAISAVPSRVL
jgi:Thioesterase-like superfamily